MELHSKWCKEPAFISFLSDIVEGKNVSLSLEKAYTLRGLSHFFQLKQVLIKGSQDHLSYTKALGYNTTTLFSEYLQKERQEKHL